MLSKTILIWYVLYSFKMIRLIHSDRYRLPLFFAPKHYTVKLLTTLDPEFTFTGTVKIFGQCLNDTKKLTLHRDEGLKNINIDLTEVDNQGRAHQANKVFLEKILYSPREDFLMIYTQEVLKKDHFYLILIEFEGEISNSTDGLFRRSVVSKDGSTSYALTNFYPVGARKVFPCFDEPNIRANFEIVIGRQEKYNSTSNMPLVKTEPVEEMDGWFWDHFMNTEPLSTYLISFMIYDDAFEWFGNPKGQLRILATLDTKKQMFMIWRTAPKLFAFLRKYLQVPFPFPKVDIVAVPHTLGNIDVYGNPGMIVIHEELISFKSPSMRPDKVHEILFYVAQQLCNQWLCIVAPTWWSEVWFVRTLSCYIARVALNAMSDGQSLERDLADHLLSFLHDKETTVISPEVVADVDSITTSINAVNCRKSGLLFRMAHLMIGQDDMKEILGRFLRSNAFQTVDQYNLWKAYETSASEGIFSRDGNLSEVMNTWIYKSRYPVVNVKRKYKDNEAILTQSNFYETTDDEKTYWWIPISYTTKDENRTKSTKVREWLKPSGELLEISSVNSSDWLLVNLHMISPYRVEYDLRNWDLLGSFLRDPRRFKQIPVFNRMQLIDDICTFAKLGKVSYEFLFDFLIYLEIENRYAPWAAAVKNLVGFHWRIHRNSETVRLLNMYMQKLLKPHFMEKKLNFTENSLVDVTLRALIIEYSCFFGLNDCLIEVRNLFKIYEKDSDSTTLIPIEIRSIIFCYAIKHGSPSDFNFLFDKWQKSDDIIEREDMLMGLYCSKSFDLIKKIPNSNKVKRRIKFPTKLRVNSSETQEQEKKIKSSSDKEKLLKRTKDNHKTGPLANRNRQKLEENEKIVSDQDEHEEKTKQNEISYDDKTNSLRTEGNNFSDSKITTSSNEKSLSEETVSTENFSEFPSDETELLETTPESDESLSESSSPKSSNEPDLTFILKRSKFDIASAVFYENLDKMHPTKAVQYIRIFAERIREEKDLTILKEYFETNNEKFHLIRDFLDETFEMVEKNLGWQDKHTKLIEIALRKHLKINATKSEARRNMPFIELTSLLIFSSLFI
ncbi:hypothetical protein HHI36_009410 [Cryptolaemus montrouzieri]|uniref:Aminopeptidase n=1 Tax=Cryptolaemus montrouzieri TaxID=559131 RepID=A0ABD2MVM7_9CUCU